MAGDEVGGDVDSPDSVFCIAFDDARSGNGFSEAVRAVAFDKTKERNGVVCVPDYLKGVLQDLTMIILCLSKRGMSGVKVTIWNLIRDMAWGI